MSMYTHRPTLYTHRPTLYTHRLTLYTHACAHRSPDHHNISTYMHPPKLFSPAIRPIPKDSPRHEHPCQLQSGVYLIGGLGIERLPCKSFSCRRTLKFGLLNCSFLYTVKCFITIKNRSRREHCSHACLRASLHHNYMHLLTCLLSGFDGVSGCGVEG